MEAYILDKNKIVIKKENLINEILEKSKNDFVSLDDLLELIDNATNDEGVILKKKLIKSIKNHHTKAVIKDIYNNLENIIFNTLSSVNEEQDVCIKLFEGISLDGVYVQEKVKKDNFTGEVKLVSSKIKPKFNITRPYCEKLNSNK